MQQNNPELFESYARECERRAEAANDQGALFLDLAAEWRELAHVKHSRSRNKNGKTSNRTSRLPK